MLLYGPSGGLHLPFSACSHLVSILGVTFLVPDRNIQKPSECLHIRTVWLAGVIEIDLGMMRHRRFYRLICGKCGVLSPLSSGLDFGDVYTVRNFQSVYTNRLAPLYPKTLDVHPHMWVPWLLWPSKSLESVLSPLASPMTISFASVLVGFSVL